MEPFLDVARAQICVYMASRHGSRPSYTQAARALGTALADHHCDLVYGGGSVGLMGEVADAVLDRGHRVTGIITEHLYDREVGHAAVTELVVVPDMQTRKREMFERSQGFVILPGGVGTMEELFEVWCWATLGLHPKPIAIVNTEGYYDHLLAFLDRGVGDELVSESAMAVIHVGTDVDAVVGEIVSTIAALDEVAVGAGD